MKRRGRHPHQALTARKVRTLNKPGMYTDGNGLYLRVDDTGAREPLNNSM